MKKLFVEPKIEVKGFELENILTASGDTNLGKAQNALSGFDSITIKSVNDILAF